MKHFLPGESEIMLASARPAARAYYLLYAAAVGKALANSCEGSLRYNALKETYDDVINIYQEYKKIYPIFSEVINYEYERRVLKSFLASGYTGELKAEIIKFVENTNRNIIKDN